MKLIRSRYLPGSLQRGYALFEGGIAMATSKREAIHASRQKMLAITCTAGSANTV
jgi:hypothetical protein